MKVRRIKTRLDRRLRHHAAVAWLCKAREYLVTVRKARQWIAKRRQRKAAHGVSVPDGEVSARHIPMGEK